MTVTIQVRQEGFRVLLMRPNNLRGNSQSQWSSDLGACLFLMTYDLVKGQAREDGKALHFCILFCIAVYFSWYGCIKMSFGMDDGNGTICYALIKGLPTSICYVKCEPGDGKNIKQFTELVCFKQYSKFLNKKCS